MKINKWAVFSPNFKRKLGEIRCLTNIPEQIAVAQYGRGIVLVLMDKTYFKYYVLRRK